MSTATVTTAIDAALAPAIQQAECYAHLAEFFPKWCAWKYAKDKKPPIGSQGTYLKSTDQTGWLGLAESLEAREKYEGDGVGVLMLGTDGIVGFDLDGVLDEHGGVIGSARELVALLQFCCNSYIEVSPSGRGLRAFVLGKKPAGIKKDDNDKDKEKVLYKGKHSVEIYDGASERYLTVTGKPWGAVGFRAITEDQDCIGKFHREAGFMADAKVESKVKQSAGDDTDPDPDTDCEQHSDEEILKLLKTRNKRGKITRLWAGNLSDYGGDNSSADLALCNEIAYYTKDPEQINRIFKQSQLGKREKWKRRDYRESTITKAIESCKGHYWCDITGGDLRKKADSHLIDGQEGLEGLQMANKGQTLATTLANVTDTLLRDRRTAGLLYFNEFSGRIELVRSLRDALGEASDWVGPLRDRETGALRVWLSRAWGLNPRADEFEIALMQVAAKVSWNPLTEALDDLQWDGKPRIDRWLVDYLGTEDAGIADYVRDAGRCWLIGAVARAYRPGCKMDTLLVLEGAQGAGKSQAARSLAEAILPSAFAENIPSITGEAIEARRSVRGRWVVELGELAATRKADAEDLKAFLSAQTDNVRMPYGRAFEDVPRSCVFIASTNESGWLRDATGGRRFWPVRVGRINLAALRQDAKQLWAEAVVRFRAGDAWHLTNLAALEQAGAEQFERLPRSSWGDAVEDMAHKLYSKGCVIDRWKLNDLWTLTWGKDPENGRIDKSDEVPFAAALRTVGFDRNTKSRWFMSDRLLKKCEEAARPCER